MSDESQIDELKRVLLASETWRRAYADAKYRMYSMGGEMADYAMAFMPCSEGPLERAVSKALGPELDKELREKAWAWHEQHDAKYKARQATPPPTKADGETE